MAHLKVEVKGLCLDLLRASNWAAWMDQNYEMLMEVYWVLKRGK